MQTYNYRTDSGTEFKIKFSSMIYPAVKKKHGVILEQELQSNPYSKDVLATCVFEMHKKACDDHSEELVMSLQSITDSLEVDEMLYIYTMVMLERGATLTKRISPVKTS
jgi:hypothetical protein